MRIEIPTNPDDLIALAKAILAKNTAVGAASPLANIDGIDQFGPKTTTADTQNQLAADLARQSEKATELRDNALGSRGPLTEGTVRWFVTSARDVLLGLNKGKERQLGDWGFTVNDPAAAAATPAPATTPKP